MITTNDIDYCLKWFQLHDINAFEYDNSIYIVVVSDFELQLSSAEVAYRADLYKSIMEEPK